MSYQLNDKDHIFITKKYHPYHLVDNSPWPLILSIFTLNIIYYFVILFLIKKKFLLIWACVLVVCILVVWFADIIKESYIEGYHNKKVLKNLKIGMLLFIISEILFFFSFFWAFFHSSLSPSIDIHCLWPPKNIVTLNILHHPLINTIFLLFSALTVTICHYSLINGRRIFSLETIITTIIFGLWFLYTQYIEYTYSLFSISDSVYGSIFFLLTGFHGFHVIIGLIFLFISYIRLYSNQLSKNHHFILEASIWYWHFVDVVWLFLYISLYWWGSLYIYSIIKY